MANMECSPHIGRDALLIPVSEVRAYYHTITAPLSKPYRGAETELWCGPHKRKKFEGKKIINKPHIYTNKLVSYYTVSYHGHASHYNVVADVETESVADFESVGIGLKPRRRCVGLT